MSQKNIFIIIIFALLILVLGVFVYKNKNKEFKNTTGVLKNSSDFAKADSSQSVSGRIYYTSTKDGVSKIISYDLSQKENQTIFSDADEDYKLTTLASFAYLSQEYIVLEKKDNMNQLVSIKITDTAEKTVLSDSFSLAESLAVSPDGQTIFFSNYKTTDGKKKYYLYGITRDNKNLRQFFESDVSIKNLVSNKNGSEVAFLQDDKRIVVLNLDTLKQKEIYHTSNRIYALSWHENGSLIFSESQGEKLVSGKVLSCDENGGNLKTVLATKNNFPDSPIISPDFLATAYSLKNFTDSYDANAEGEIDFTLISDEVVNKIGSGASLIAWGK